MKHFLCLETSTEVGSLGLFRIENKKLSALVIKNWASKSEGKNQIQHSKKLPLEIQKSLQEARLNLKDLDFFAVGVGPGRFTGVRTAVAIIKSLAFCFKKPCYPVNSLQITAEAFLSSQREVSVAFNAFKDSVYFADFKDQKIIVSPQVMSFSQWSNYMIENKKKFCIGDVNKFYKIPESLNKQCEFKPAYAQSVDLATIVFRDFEPTKLKPWFQLEPLYLRSIEK